METLFDISERVRVKGKSSHGYIKLYDRLFKDIRDQTKKVLEIGIGDGCSLRLWSEFFSNAEVYGVDIDPKKIEEVDALNISRVTVDVLDQGDKKALLKLANKLGPFDVVVDDGGHKMSQQIDSFETLWLHTNLIYVIEDVFTSYWVDSPHDYVDRKPTCVQYFKDYVDKVCFVSQEAGFARWKSRLTYDNLDEYQRTLQSIEFLPGLIALKKRVI